MNIVLLGHEDIASVTALDTLVRRCPRHDYTVFWSGQMPRPKTPAPTLEALAAADREQFRACLAKSEAAPLFRRAQPLAAPNNDAGLERLQQLQPDLIVSVRYRRILRDAAIAIPTHGVLNLHSGILPDYRGVMATFWAMLNREAEIGTTLHRINDAGIDTGPVIGISRQPVDYRSSYLENVLSLYTQGCTMLSRAVDDIAAGYPVHAQAQNPGDGCYFGAPTEADARRFLERGMRLWPTD